MKIPADELRLADVVELKLCSGSYKSATVKQIKDGQVTLFRPYVSTADFSYTGGVICYIGIEEFSIPADSQLFEVTNRKVLK